jgi:alcohol dehydrogenase class IV
MAITQFEMPRTRRVLAGAGSRRALPAELDAIGAGRIAIVTSPSVASQAMYRELRSRLGDRVSMEYCRIRPHPATELIVELITLSAAARPDAYLAVGGGSVIDAAKLAAFGVAERITDTGQLVGFSAHAEDQEREPMRPATAEPRPVVAVPTTLSAAEWNGFAATVDTESATKLLLRQLAITPAVVCLDPELAASTPRTLWASTGIRAVDHAIETTYARSAMPVTSALALGALSMLQCSLADSVHDPANLAAAQECQWAAMMSIIGVHNVPLGLSHAIGHQLGAHGVPHGMTSCVTLPHVMRLLLPVTRQAQDLIATAMGRTAASEAANAVHDLIASLGVPFRLRDLGVPRSSFRQIARATLGDVVARESPGELTEESVIGVLEAAW